MDIMSEQKTSPFVTEMYCIKTMCDATSGFLQ